MNRVPLWLPLCLAHFFALAGSAFFPEIKLLSFAPCFAFLYNRLSFSSALWAAAFIGCFIDLVSAELRLGSYAFIYMLTTFVLYHQKRHFFEDKAVAFSLFTASISIVLTLIEWCLIAVFGKPIPLSKKLIATDLMLLPLADALYAFLLFSCPMKLYLYVKKRGLRTLWQAMFGAEKKQSI